MLDRNRIRYIDPDAFSSLGRLRELRLEENGLRSLTNLQHLTGLQVSVLCSIQALQQWYHQLVELMT